MKLASWASPWPQDLSLRTVSHEILENQYPWGTETAHNSSTWKLFKNITWLMRGEFFCLLEIGRRGEIRGKISELPDNYPHCAPLTLQSLPRPCASTPSTGTHAHRNLTYTYHLRVSPPGWQSLWQLGTTKAFFPHSTSFPRLPAPQPRGEANVPQTYGKLAT